MGFSRLRLLKEALGKLGEITCIIERVKPGARVYLAGGAAEDRLTVLSDIDVMIVLDHEPDFEEAVSIREKILEAMEARGIPLYLPIEFHIVGPEGLRRYKSLRKLVCVEGQG